MISRTLVVSVLAAAASVTLTSETGARACWRCHWINPCWTCISAGSQSGSVNCSATCESCWESVPCGPFLREDAGPDGSVSPEQHDAHRPDSPSPWLDPASTLTTLIDSAGGEYSRDCRGTIVVRALTPQHQLEIRRITSNLII